VPSWLTLTHRELLIHHTISSANWATSVKNTEHYHEIRWSYSVHNNSTQRSTSGDSNSDKVTSLNLHYAAYQYQINAFGDKSLDRHDRNSAGDAVTSFSEIVHCRSNSCRHLAFTKCLERFRVQYSLTSCSTDIQSCGNQ